MSYFVSAEIMTAKEELRNRGEKRDKRKKKTRMTEISGKD